MATSRAKTSDASPSGPDRPLRGEELVTGFDRRECLPNRATAVWRTAAVAVYVSLYAANNAIGRLFWEAVSDKIGRQKVLVCMFNLTALMLFILANASAVLGFAIGITGIGLSFGGVMGVFPSIATEQFGARHFGLSYGIMFTGYFMAAFFGPRIAASIGPTEGTLRCDPVRTSSHRKGAHGHFIFLSDI